jgi:hypothetical protein
MSTRVDSVNRIILALLGTALLALAALGVARGLGRLGQAPPSQPLLDAERVLAGDWWVMPVVAVLALVLALLSLRWLVAQVTRERLRHLEVDATRSGGDTWLRTAAIAEAVEREVQSHPGVAKARMTLEGRPSRHRHRLVVTLTDRADIPAVRQGLTATTIPQLRRALDFDQSEIDVEFVLAPRERRRLR